MDIKALSTVERSLAVSEKRNTIGKDSCGQERSRETVYSSGQCVKKQCGRISSCPRAHLAHENAQNYMDSTAAARKRNSAEKPVISMVCRLMKGYIRDGKNTFCVSRQYMPQPDG